MIKRTIEISREPAHLSVRMNQLTLRRLEQTVGTFPCEDLGVVVVDHPQTTYTHAALAALAQADATLVVCGHDHLPVGVLLPLADHTQVVSRVKEQIAIGKPLCKRLWKQIVQAKIRRQAANLASSSPSQLRLLRLADSVRSGDPTNAEAQAAKVYWSAWLTEAQNSRRDSGATLMEAGQTPCLTTATPFFEPQWPAQLSLQVYCRRSGCITHTARTPFV